MPRKVRPETNGHKPDTVPVEVQPDQSPVDEAPIDVSPVDAPPDARVADQPVDVPVNWKPADQFPADKPYEDKEPDRIDTTDYQTKSQEELEKEKKRKPPGFPFPDFLPDYDPDTRSWDLPDDLNSDPDPAPDGRRPDRTIPAAPYMGGNHDAHSIRKWDRLIRETKTGMTYTSPDGEQHKWQMKTNRRYRPSLW